jgi:predicted lipoprotein
VPEVRGTEERDSALRFQFGEWDEQRQFDQVIRWVLRGRRQLLRGWVRLQLSSVVIRANDLTAVPTPYALRLTKLHLDTSIDYLWRSLC